ncbi:uncharacterized protein METZ01_LOCUS284616 [marine metagenome]|uniref:Uncharacterized protein n=1 Tax=marine metagenome TaxID=408172 RepID=A0A382L9C3_9ZZZZ
MTQKKTHDLNQKENVAHSHHNNQKQSLFFHF